MTRTENKEITVKDWFANQSETANKIAEKINTEKVKKTVREIDRVVAVASSLFSALTVTFFLISSSSLSSS